MSTVEQGQPVALSSHWYTYAGGPPTDLDTTPTIGIVEVATAAVVLAPTAAPVTHPGLGVYSYTWATSLTQALGDYLVTWSGTVTGAPVVATETVTVTAPVEHWALFDLRHLQLYLADDTITAEVGKFAHDLIASDIRNAIGAARYDALTDLSVLRSIALEVARRRGMNPGGLRSEAIDDYTVQYASESIGGSLLTVDEIRRLRRAAGIRSGAFSITPTAPTPPDPCAAGRTYP